jgi:hypothetical protein
MAGQRGNRHSAGRLFARFDMTLNVSLYVLRKRHFA